MPRTGGGFAEKVPMGTAGEFLRLAERTPVANGKWRRVYEHPEGPERLIKVPRRDTEAQVAAKTPPGMRRLHRYYIGPVMLRRELAEYRRMAAEPVSERRFLQEFLGLVATDLGPGLVVRAVRTEAGALAPTLQRLLDEGGDPAPWLGQLEEFLAWFATSAVVTRDFRPQNLVHDAAGGRFVLIDGLGDRTILPFCAWSPARNRRHKARAVRGIMRRVRRQLAAAGHALPVAGAQSPFDR